MLQSSLVTVETAYGLFEQMVNEALSQLGNRRLVDVKFSTASKGGNVVYSALIIYEE